ncbi:hypothetical protein Tco_1154653 [Tanacetum coccineum]
MKLPDSPPAPEVLFFFFLATRLNTEDSSSSNVLSHHTHDRLSPLRDLPSWVEGESWAWEHKRAYFFPIPFLPEGYACCNSATKPLIPGVDDKNQISQQRPSVTGCPKCSRLREITRSSVEAPALLAGQNELLIL